MYVSFITKPKKSEFGHRLRSLHLQTLGTSASAAAPLAAKGFTPSAMSSRSTAFRLFLPQKTNNRPSRSITRQKRVPFKRRRWTVRSASRPNHSIFFFRGWCIKPLTFRSSRKCFKHRGKVAGKRWRERHSTYWLRRDLLFIARLSVP